MTVRRGGVRMKHREAAITLRALIDQRVAMNLAGLHWIVVSNMKKVELATERHEAIGQFWRHFWQKTKPRRPVPNDDQYSLALSHRYFCPKYSVNFGPVEDTEISWRIATCKGMLKRLLRFQSCAKDGRNPRSHDELTVRAPKYCSVRR